MTSTMRWFSNPFFIFIILLAMLMASCPIDNGDTNGDVTPPSVPTGFVAIAVSTSQVNLSWSESTDNVGVSGYKIYRGGAYLKSVTSGTATTDTGLSANTAYCYNVSSYDATNNESGQTVQQCAITTQETQYYTLTVIQEGLGYGVISSSPAGINCPGTCSSSFPSGTTVALTAVAGGGSTFASWSGQDTASGTSCTINMTSDRTVTATFALNISGSFTLSLPATDSDGTYTLSWTYSGALVPLNWSIQEDSDSSFSSPTVYVSYDTTSPYAYTFTNKPDGVYYYRVGAPSGGWSEWVSTTVARPTTAVLRITNNTRYDMIDIRLNGQQQVNYPYFLLAGKSANFTFNSPGTVNFLLGVGFYNTHGSRDVWFTLSGSTTTYAGLTTTITFDNPTIGQLLSGFNTSGRYWDGYYFDSNGGYHTAQFWFSYNGTWRLYDDGDQIGSGTVALVSWVNYASIVTFKVCSGCQDIVLPYPFGRFSYQNGPMSWPTIEYVAR